MSTPIAQPRALAGLLDDLTKAGVTLPVEVANAAATLEAAASVSWSARPPRCPAL